MRYLEKVSTCQQAAGPVLRQSRLVYSPLSAVVDMVRMDARAEQISNNNALIPLPYAPPDQPHDDLTPVVMAKFWSLRNSEGH